MKFIITLPLQTGGHIQVEAYSPEDFNAARNYLVEQGLVFAPSNAAAPPAAAANTVAGSQQPDGGAEQPAARGRGRPRKEESAAQQAAAGSAPAASSAKTVTVEDATTALQAYVQKFGVQEAMALNQRFGVQKLGQLKPEQYADYVKLAEDCMSTGKPASAAQSDDMSSLV